LAIAGNAFITLIKFVGFFMSGSVALFSEAVHSVADTLNQGLLMVGLQRSTKKADDEFSYGYGQERFLWALISACGIFFLGAGVTVYRGITSLLHPETVHITPIIFGILLTSFAIESITLAMAVRELRRRGHGRKFAWLLQHGDPTTIAVIYEDSVAVLGVLVALGSVMMTYLTGSHYWDAIGSVIIGVMLGVVAVILIAKNRSFLIKRNIPPEMRRRIVEIMEAEPAIERVIDFKSTVLDVGVYQVKCEIEFNGTALMTRLYKSEDIKEEYELLRDDYAEFLRFLSWNVDRVARVMGSTIDEIEKKIQKELPEVRHIDIELN
ncbi:cation diffusion facilitator family transporter, partial [Patescibacteria group bacterium]